MKNFGIDVILTIFATVNHSKNQIITMMKKLFLAMLVGMMALGVMAQSGKLTVTGSYKGLGDSVRVFVVDSDGKMLVQESRAIAGDELDMTFDLDDAAMLYIFGLEDGQLSAENGFAIPALTSQHAVTDS